MSLCLNFHDEVRPEHLIFWWDCHMKTRKYPSAHKPAIIIVDSIYYIYLSKNKGGKDAKLGK